MISSKTSVMGCVLPRRGFFPGSVMSIEDFLRFLLLRRFGVCRLETAQPGLGLTLQAVDLLAGLTPLFRA